ncbi:unnamed protein product [Amoebophrya sp. A120]|nr:unnamed protein product [Amoebophrya sp. A120]|eukprot:GSA120T00022803001.1
MVESGSVNNALSNQGTPQQDSISLVRRRAKEAGKKPRHPQLCTVNLYDIREDVTDNVDRVKDAVLDYLHSFQQLSVGNKKNEAKNKAINKKSGAEQSPGDDEEEPVFFHVTLEVYGMEVSYRVGQGVEAWMTTDPRPGLEAAGQDEVAGALKAVEYPLPGTGPPVRSSKYTTLLLKKAVGFTNLTVDEILEVVDSGLRHPSTKKNNAFQFVQGFCKYLGVEAEALPHWLLEVALTGNVDPEENQEATETRAFQVTGVWIQEDVAKLMTYESSAFNPVEAEAQFRALLPANPGSHTGVVAATQDPFAPRGGKLRGGALVCDLFCDKSVAGPVVDLLPGLGPSSLPAGAAAPSAPGAGPGVGAAAIAGGGTAASSAAVARNADADVRGAALLMQHLYCEPFRRPEQLEEDEILTQDRDNSGLLVKAKSRRAAKLRAAARNKAEKMKGRTKSGVGEIATRERSETYLRTIARNGIVYDAAFLSAVEFETETRAAMSTNVLQKKPEAHPARFFQLLQQNKYVVAPPSTSSSQGPQQRAASSAAFQLVSSAARETTFRYVCHAFAEETAFWVALLLADHTLLRMEQEQADAALRQVHTTGTEAAPLEPPLTSVPPNLNAGAGRSASDFLTSDRSPYPTGQLCYAIGRLNHGLRVAEAHNRRGSVLSANSTTSSTTLAAENYVGGPPRADATSFAPSLDEQRRRDDGLVAPEEIRALLIRIFPLELQQFSPGRQLLAAKGILRECLTREQEGRLLLQPLSSGLEDQVLQRYVKLSANPSGNKDDKEVAEAAMRLREQRQRQLRVLSMNGGRSPGTGTIIVRRRASDTSLRLGPADVNESRPEGGAGESDEVSSQPFAVVLEQCRAQRSAGCNVAQWADELFPQQAAPTASAALTSGDKMYERVRQVFSPAVKKEQSAALCAKYGRLQHGLLSSLVL